jgi:4-amino-4-deoxy-L-arabinose transferase-like glycosyltransferase
MIARRLTPCIWLLVGAGMSFLLLVWLAFLAPRQTLFNTFEFHFFYRSPNNWVALHISLRTLTELLNSGQFMLLVIFAGMGLLFVFGQTQWEVEQKAEFFLCFWLAAGLGLFLISARITYPQYFILLVPFLSILASVGIVSAASWLRPPGRSAWLVPGVLVLFVAGLPWWLSQQRNRLTWPQLMEVARAVNYITPQDGLIWADAMIYFAAQRIPLSGLEHFDSHKLRFSPEESASLHVVPRADLYDWIAAGRFATVATCFATEDWIDESGMRKIYTKRTTINGCDIFWSKAPQ